MRCDGSGCVLAREGRRVLLAFGPDALAEDCGEVDALVSTIAAYDLCHEGFIVDRIHLAQRGAHAIWIGEEGIRARSAIDGTGRRIWMRGSVELSLTETPEEPEDVQR